MLFDHMACSGFTEGSGPESRPQPLLPGLYGSGFPQGASDLNQTVSCDRGLARPREGKRPGRVTQQAMVEPG